MFKVQKSVLIFFFILAQASLAVLGGFVFLNLVSRDSIPAGIVVGSVDIGGLSPDDALKKLEASFDDKLKNGSFTVIYGNNEKFSMKYSDIGAVFDGRTTLERITGTGAAGSVNNLVKRFFFLKDKRFVPVMEFNEEKLKVKIKELASIMEKDPINADIAINKDGMVVKSASVPGRRLNFENAVKRISSEMTNDPDKPLVLSSEPGREIDIMRPGTVESYFDGVDSVISTYSTAILDPDDEYSAKVAAAAVNKVRLLPKSPDGGAAGEFSFGKYLAKAGALSRKTVEGYNQVASTIYAAALLAGITQDAFDRTPHDTPAAYIDAGLDAIVSGNEIDFRFKNMLDCKLILFVTVKDGHVYASIAGHKRSGAGNSLLETEVVQEFDPPVVNVENRDLEPGEKKLIDPGKEGVKVNVYRVMVKDKTETSRKLLYTDDYKAVETIVQVGPDTGWNSGDSSK